MMDEKLELFVDKIKEAFRENLLSIILYGSRANAEGLSGKADYNLLLIVKSLEFRELKALSVAMPKWLKAGNNPPAIFTRDRFLNSSDVFPMDFIEIKNRRELLFGEDPFEKMEISRAYLRHQVEFELRSKILRLTESYMRYFSDPGRMRELLASSFSPIIVILRNVARLCGQDPTQKKIEFIKIFAGVTKEDSGVLLKIMALKDGEREAKKLDSLQLAEEYLIFLEKIADFVDGIK
jgi:hypothetical protein